MKGKVIGQEKVTDLEMEIDHAKGIGRVRVIVRETKTAPAKRIVRAKASAKRRAAIVSNHKRNGRPPCTE